jgi:hypothetical protein
MRSALALFVSAGSDIFRERPLVVDSTRDNLKATVYAAAKSNKQVE